MRRILNLLKKDVLLGIKDVFILLEIIFSVVIVLIILFLIPQNIDSEETVFIYDRSGVINRFTDRFGSQNIEMDNELFVDSRQEIIDGMKENKTALGVIITANDDRTFHVELLTQPYTSETMTEYLEVNLEDLFSIFTGTYPPDVYRSVRVTALQENIRDEIPFNKQLLPAIMLMMVGMVGLFAMISVTGQEHSEATIRAFRVSPASMTEFLLSKHLMLLGVSLITFSILYIPVIGLSGYFQGLLIILLTVILGSSIGIILSAFFDSPMSSVGWVLILMLVFSLPAVSLFAPVFSPGWLRLIPSYHTLFGLDAAMFPDNNAQIIWQSAGLLAGIDIVLLFFSTWIFRLRIQREL
ncbi:MAG: ABC transporter permease [Candidatus Marinimicrobia bacterium]|nr:ABC transporter permease [Candidatus Neomarinimicrobiota bacterium]